MFQKGAHNPRPLCCDYALLSCAHNIAQSSSIIHMIIPGLGKDSIDQSRHLCILQPKIFRRELNAWCQLTARGLKWCSAFWVTEGHCVKWNNIILDPSKISIPVRKSLWITVETGISCYFMSVSSWPSMLTLFSLNISLRWCANMCKWDRMSVLVKNWPFVSNPTL